MDEDTSSPQAPPQGGHAGEPTKRRSALTRSSIVTFLMMNRARPLRLTLAGLLLVFALAGGVFGWFQVCEETQRGSTNVKSVCREPSVTDAPVVFGGILLLLLIAPDFEEAGLFGFSLKRRLERQEQRQQTLEGQLTLFATRIDSVAAANAKAVANVYLTPEVLRVAKADIDRKERDFREIAGPVQQGLNAWIAEVRPEDTSRVLEEIPAVTAPDDAELRSEVVGLWDELNRLVVNPPRRSLMDLVKDPVREQFRSVFDEEIRILRAVRDAVVDGQMISPDTLRESVEIGRRLTRIARQALVDPSTG